MASTSSSHNDDDEFIDEEILVYADFQSKIVSSTLRDSSVKMIGFETGQPIMEIGDKIFQGSFEHAIGTHIFFDENPVPPPSLENYETIPANWYKYLTKTDRVMRMNRIFVDARDGDNDEAKPAASSGVVAVDANATPAASAPIQITKSYAMALNQFLKPGEEPPRSVDDEDEVFYRKFGDSAENK